MAVKYLCRAADEGQKEGSASEYGRCSVLRLYSAGGGEPGGRGLYGMWSDELFLKVTPHGLEKDKCGQGLCNGQNKRSDDRPGVDGRHQQGRKSVSHEGPTRWNFWRRRGRLKERWVSCDHGQSVYTCRQRCTGGSYISNPEKMI